MFTIKDIKAKNYEKQTTQLHSKVDSKYTEDKQPRTSLNFSQLSLGQKIYYSLNLCK